MPSEVAENLYYSVVVAVRFACRVNCRAFVAFMPIY